MNWKKLLFSFIGVIVVMEVLSYIIHGLILGSTYMGMTGVWRENMESMMWVMYLGDLVFAFFFVWIFAKGYEGKGLMEGVRYGLTIAGLVVIMGNLAQYAAYLCYTTKLNNPEQAARLLAQVYAEAKY